MTRKMEIRRRRRRWHRKRRYNPIFTDISQYLYFNISSNLKIIFCMLNYEKCVHKNLYNCSAISFHCFSIIRSSKEQTSILVTSYTLLILD
jgi:hypothetical protein